MAIDCPTLRAFLHGGIEGPNFRHADHLRVGFEILRRHDFAEASVVLRRGLRDIASRAGNASAYHETITIAFLSLIAERAASNDYSDFNAFARANEDLMDKAILTRWYGRARLNSDIARKTFVLPEPLS
jgi:hypothetical protein